MKNDSLVICPVYNEHSSLDEFYRTLRRYYFRDVLFVDDGSKDASGDFLTRMRGSSTFLIQHFNRRGYGATLLSGFGFALQKGYRRIVTIDTDLQHNPEHIPLFLRELMEFEVVLGSRYIRIDRYFNVPKERMLINRYIASLIKLLFSVEFTDPFCGFRGYRSSFLKDVRLSEKSYGMGLEILMEIIRKKAPFTEIPVEAIYFEDMPGFLDGFHDPRPRLLHYLETITRKRKEIKHEKKVLNSKPAS